MVRRTALAAPGITFEVSGVSDDGFNRLKSGDLDFLVFPERDNHLASVRSVPLCELRYAVLVRRDHPWLSSFRDGRPDWKVLARYDKVQLTIDSFGTRAPGGLDEWVFQGGFPRQRTAVWTPYVHAGTELLLDSDLTMIVQEHLAGRLEATGLFRAVPVEVPESRYTVGFLWHERSDLDTALEWLRAVFVSVFAGKCR